MTRPAWRSLAPAGTFAVMLLVAAAGISSHGMGNDESASRWAAMLGLRQLHHLVDNVDAVHALYYLLLHAWAVVGTSPTVLRIPSLLGMAGAAAIATALGTRLTRSAGVGIGTGLFMAAMPAISFYAQTARSYALVFLAVSTATLVLVRNLSGEAAQLARFRSRRAWVGYAVLVTVAGYLNEMALLVLVAHCVTVLSARPRRRARARWLLAAGAAVIAVAPLVVLSTRQTSALTLKRPGIHALIGALGDYAGSNAAAATLVIACAIVGVAVPSTVARGTPTLAQVAVPLVFVPLSVLYVESLVAKPLFADRYVLWGALGVALLAARGAYRIAHSITHRTALRVAMLLVLVATVGAVQIGKQAFVRTDDARLFDFTGPANYVAAHAESGDGALFDTGFFRKIRLGCPECFAGIDDVALAIDPSATGTFRGRNLPPGALEQRMLEHDRLWVLGRVPKPETSGAPFSVEQRVLAEHFRLISRTTFHGVTVTLWQRLTVLGLAVYVPT